MCRTDERFLPKEKMKIGACFNCGDIGHISKNCPKKQGQGPQVGPSGGTSLTFLLDALFYLAYLLNPILRNLGRTLLDVNM